MEKKRKYIYDEWQDKCNTQIFGIGIRIDETFHSFPDWQSDYDGGGLGIAEATNIRTPPRTGQSKIEEAL